MKRICSIHEVLDSVVIYELRSITSHGNITRNDSESELMYVLKNGPDGTLTDTLHLSTVSCRVFG